MTHPLPEGEAGHSLVDDDAVVFQVELDAPPVKGVRPDDDFIGRAWGDNEVVGDPDPVDAMKYIRPWFPHILAGQLIFLLSSSTPLRVVSTSSYFSRSFRSRRSACLPWA